MKLFHPLLFVLTMMTAIVAHAGGDDSSQCIFDPEAFDSTWLDSRPALRGADWDAGSKSFSLQLAAGSFVYIHGGGCDSYSETYQLIQVNVGLENIRSSQWHKSQISALAQLTLSQDALVNFSQKLAQQNLLVQAEHYELLFEPELEGAPSYFIQVDRVNHDLVIFTLSWSVE